MVIGWRDWSDRLYVELTENFTPDNHSESPLTRAQTVKQFSNQIWKGCELTKSMKLVHPMRCAREGKLYVTDGTSIDTDRKRNQNALQKEKDKN